MSTYTRLELWITLENHIWDYMIFGTKTIYQISLIFLMSWFTTPSGGLGPGGWVNGNKYLKPQELFGVLPITQDIQTNLGMLVYHPGYAASLKIWYPYLAAQQEMWSAVVPIHTKAEQSLFKMLIHETNGLFAGKQELSWDTVAVRWAGYSDSMNIFYKVSTILTPNGRIT